MSEFILKYWVEVLLTGISSFVVFTYKRIKDRFKKQDEKREAIEKGVQALLRNELIQRFREYKLAGEMTLLDKENMDHMFTEYFNLGGNGMMQEVYLEFKEIPIKIIK
jgi:hypothetical protein